MYAIPSRVDRSAVADASPNPAVNATPTLNQEQKRLFSLQGGEGMKQFAAKLKANAQWMEQFLHGDGAIPPWQQVSGATLKTGAEKMMPAVRTIANRYRVFVNAEGRVVAQKQ